MNVSKESDAHDDGPMKRDFKAASRTVAQTVHRQLCLINSIAVAVRAGNCHLCPFGILRVKWRHTVSGLPPSLCSRFR